MADGITTPPLRESEEGTALLEQGAGWVQGESWDRGDGPPGRATGPVGGSPG